MHISIFPRLGPLLRALITNAGYRCRITELGLDKDLDDLALDARPGSSCDLMLQIESATQREIARDCGVRWAETFGLAWYQTRRAIQKLVLEVDGSAIANEAGRASVQAGFDVPMLSSSVRLLIHNHPGIDAYRWWQSPIAAWAELAARTGNVSESEIIARLHDTPRTTERWLSGEPVGELQWPYRPTVERVLGNPKQSPDSQKEIDLLTGWLTVAVAFQSLPIELRLSIGRDFELRKQQPWNLEKTISTLNRLSHDAGARPIRERAVALLREFERRFASPAESVEAPGRLLAEFQRMINVEPDAWQQSYQPIHDWFSGRVAGLQGDEADALRLYASAVEGAWWVGGANQHPMLNEALLYAVGIGDNVAAKRYWDKTFMLGLNRWPKRPLDEQERRRLAFAFEAMFAPQKAKDRVPPDMEVIVRDGPFELSADQLKNPNRKVKYAEGRTRRTPLMDAIRDGSLADVKRAIAAGGNPDDYIKESGEGPLSYAMRRACDRDDKLVMDYLLSLELLPDTVNHEASTSRETPLKFAIEMADASTVERLIVLGAEIEATCGYQPSALCYAMMLLHGSIHRDDPTQELAYLSGKTRADVYDAKQGAALDVDLAARRAPLAALRDASPRNRAIYEAVRERYTRPEAPRRKVVEVLLRKGANANRRYKVEPHHLSEWTPTLFAAQVGDLDIFKSLIKHGGDPDAVLMSGSALERYDAMWIAIDHGRHAVVDFLVKRGAGSQRT